MSLLPNLAAATTVTRLQSAGNANANGAVLDLKDYKGPVTFVLAVGQITTGLGAANLNVANIESSTDNSTFTAVTSGAFTAVVNAANASNVGTQLKSFDVRELGRYVRVPIQVSGTNANVPVIVDVIGQKERV
jgi:hypothetical protein